MVEQVTREELAALAADFAPKRKAFLAAHAADFASAETHKAYDAAEDALVPLLDRLRDMAQTAPDTLAAILSGR